MKKIKILNMVLLGLFLVINLNAKGAQQDNHKIYNYALRMDIDLFQFKGENLPDFIAQINKDLLLEKQKYLNEFKGTLSFFLDDLDVVYKDNFNELKIQSKVYANSDKIFSLLLDVYPYHYGSNGCQTRIKSFNYIIKNGKAKRLTLDNLTKSQICKESLFYKAISKLKEQGTKEELGLFEEDYKVTEDLLNVMEFVFDKEHLIIFFSPYSIACGASGVISVELKYKEIRDLLSTEVLEVFSTD